jgi:hypothetical protein
MHLSESDKQPVVHREPERPRERVFIDESNRDKMQGLRCPACRTQSVHLKSRIVKARQNG